MIMQILVVLFALNIDASMTFYAIDRQRPGGILFDAIIASCNNISSTSPTLVIVIRLTSFFL